MSGANGTNQNTLTHRERRRHVASIVVLFVLCCSRVAVAKTNHQDMSTSEYKENKRKQTVGARARGDVCVTRESATIAKDN